MENQILKTEEFVNLSNNICGRSDVITTNKAGFGYGYASGWSNFTSSGYGYASGRSNFTSSGYGAGIGVEIHRNGCYGDGAACIERNEYEYEQYR